jgi:hypothetical protein
MNCKAAFPAAALVAAAYAVTLGASWSETIAIPSQADGGKGSDVPATVNEAGFDRATSDHPEGGADSLALGGSSASDPMAGDNAPAAVGSIADREPSTLTRLLIVFSDVRAQIFGSP